MMHPVPANVPMMSNYPASKMPFANMDDEGMLNEFLEMFDLPHSPEDEKPLEPQLPTAGGRPVEDTKEASQDRKPASTKRALPCHAQLLRCPEQPHKRDTLRTLCTTCWNSAIQNPVQVPADRIRLVPSHLPQRGRPKVYFNDNWGPNLNAPCRSFPFLEGDNVSSDVLVVFASREAACRVDNSHPAVRRLQHPSATFRPCAASKTLCLSWNFKARASESTCMLCRRQMNKRRRTGDQDLLQQNIKLFPPNASPQLSPPEFQQMSSPEIQSQSDGETPHVISGDLQVNGDIICNNNIHSKAFITRPADFAEWFQQLDPAESIEPGDVVALCNVDGLTCITKDLDDPRSCCVVGVVSSQPGYIAHWPADRPNLLESSQGHPVAFQGQTPVKLVNQCKHGAWLYATRRGGLAFASHRQCPTQVEVGKAIGESYLPEKGGPPMVNAVVRIGFMNEESKRYMSWMFMSAVALVLISLTLTSFHMAYNFGDCQVGLSAGLGARCARWWLRVISYFCENAAMWVAMLLLATDSCKEGVMPEFTSVYFWGLVVVIFCLSFSRCSVITGCHLLDLQVRDDDIFRFIVSPIYLLFIPFILRVCWMRFMKWRRLERGKGMAQSLSRKSAKYRLQSAHRTPSPEVAPGGVVKHSSFGWSKEKKSSKVEPVQKTTTSRSTHGSHSDTDDNSSLL